MIWLYFIVSIISGIIGMYTLDSYYKKELNRLALRSLNDNTFLVGSNTLDYIGSMAILDDGDLRKLIDTIDEFPSIEHEKYE